MIKQCLLSLSFLVFFTTPIQAQFENSQFNDSQVEIDLITVSPGQYYWSAFGHTALRVRTGNYDNLFGFGYFNYNEEDFFLNFAKGDMQYFLGVNDSAYELDGYKQEGRKIISQKLELTIAQKQQLVTKLLFLAQPENRYYAYDYFLNNCTSRIRDLLNEVTDGEISKQLKPQLTKTSWSDVTFPTSNQAWMNLGIAYIYGIPAFAKKSQWQLSVFPLVFSNDVKNIQTQSAWNKNFQVIHTPTKQGASFIEYSLIQTHYAVVLCVLILLLGLWVKRLAKTTTVFWLVTQSFLGMGLVFLWFLSNHSIAMWNINLLIFFPMAFLLLFENMRKPWILNGFLIINILWILTAAIFTHLYLVGFCAINLGIWYRLNQYED